jgi:N-acetylglucosamine-6-phosphate deacetylase
MNKKKTIVNAKLCHKDQLQKIEIDALGIITNISSMSDRILTTDSYFIDVRGDWISLGGIDLQINGALGLAFPDLTKDKIPLLQKICQFLWQQGVDGFLPTIVTTSIENIERALETIDEFIKNYSDHHAAKILGVHLEGPFLNPHKRGAHPAEYLLPLTLENLQKILGDRANLIKIITLAPELDPRGETISYLKSLGIIISLGHSQATAQEAKTAFKLGASMVTHAFNAMPNLHHREPGLLGEAIVNPQVYCGLIADGQHVSITMMKILLEASSYDRGIFLVSDALAPIGLLDGIYPWDSREIEVKAGTARLLDGTLSGTTLSLLVGVENLVRWGVCSIDSAIALATEAPRKAINEVGISPGVEANLLRWHWQEETKQLSWKRLVL